MIPAGNEIVVSKHYSLIVTIDKEEYSLKETSWSTAVISWVLQHNVPDEKDWGGIFILHRNSGINFIKTMNAQLIMNHNHNIINLNINWNNQLQYIQKYEGEKQF